MGSVIRRMERGKGKGKSQRKEEEEKGRGKQEGKEEDEKKDKDTGREGKRMEEGDVQLRRESKKGAIVQLSYNIT